MIVIAADRGSVGPGAASSAAATGVLTELGRALGVGHEGTYLLGSTAAGASGIEALLDGVSEPDLVDLVIVVEQPGAGDPDAPYAVISSTDTGSGPLQLRSTAERVVEAQAELVSPGQSAFGQLARLAFPSGLGGQAPLIGEGFDAVAVSAHGERPLPANEDEPDDVSPQTIDSFGRSLYALINAVDVSGPLEHGPSTYVEAGENVIPGWTLAVLSLTLLLPGLLAAIDACARVSRRAGELARPLLWALARCLPLIGALATLYGLAVAGLVPRPRFPFDPGTFPAGARAALAFALIAIALALSGFALRRFRITGAAAPVGSLAAVGLIVSLAAGVLWLTNPYLALLAAPAANVWVLADAPAGRRRAALVLIAALASLVPIAAALSSVAGALALGADAPWTFTLMVADGQIGFTAMLSGAVIAGGLLAATALALGGGGRVPALPGQR